ncbi:unnamed protein product [Didymodactylos carnosus]|uniref:Uncharacterized protein n=1 Tax=Didymodactylos carnosus TaxID=1234261 RepID=A0A814Y148_9BILA|nr:unnamed protein product [Didymodactylos carnosus]CAF1508865.1 unnamed protein product [Didymodactylos carnosus]CAF3986468.1 unnamed protein product [Didymodactylos carnosus]CAF4296884.1 unnamed protein product [Didymodactylos carnosus]
MFQLLFCLCFVTSSFCNGVGENNLFDLKSARPALCPIVGFNGMFCPGGSGSKINVTSKKLKSSTESEPVDLPNSVGMAIDISTGALLLSVLKISKGVQKWTDKQSKQTFLISPELILTEPQSSNNEKTTVSLPL